MNPDPAKHAVTIWKDGTFKVWGVMDAFYAQADPDFFLNIGMAELLAEMEKDFQEEMGRPNAEKGAALRAIVS